MKVMVVDDKQAMRDSVSATLARAGFQVVTASDGEAALGKIGAHRPGAIVTDLKMPNMDGVTLLQRVRDIDPQLPVILMTAYASLDTAIDALRLGAFDYIQKPFEGDHLVRAVERATAHYQLERENAALKSQQTQAGQSSTLVGQAKAIKQLQQQIGQIAATDSTVLIEGESGTGKEVVANLIHRNSARAEQVMLAVNCAALNAGILESELFGHEKGAFTGADQLRKGRFELAEGGTLLLDEISEMDLELQAKLLRVLQERQFERVGSSVTLDVNVRVIATTNRNLEAEIKAGRFRQDLYYRLNVLPLRLPPLRQRKSDIPHLASYFIDKMTVKQGQPEKRFDEQAMALLVDYHWPGNVRELENICERACVLSPGVNISAELISPWLNHKRDHTAECEVVVGSSQVEIAPGQSLEEIERELIIRTLDQYGGHRRKTAEALGIGVRTLGLKLKKWKEANLVAVSL